MALVFPFNSKKEKGRKALRTLNYIQTYYGYYENWSNEKPNESIGKGQPATAEKGITCDAVKANALNDIRVSLSSLSFST